MAGDSSDSTDAARSGAAAEDVWRCTDWNAVICKLCARVLESCEQN